MEPQARELNSIIRKDNPAVYGLFSERGRDAFFPRAGIISQSEEAKGKAINATIGVALDDDGQPLALDVVTKNSKLSAAETLSYSNSYGQKKLAEKWLERIRNQNPSLKSRTTTPVVTGAITHGLDIVSRLFVEKGGRIIIPDMMWENYSLIFQQVKLDTYPMFEGSGFSVGGLKRKLAAVKGKQVLLLNFPNNPTGYTITKEEADGIIQIIKESAERGNRILAICDDAYFGLFFEDDIFKESLFSKLAGIHENVLAVKLDGITKELYAWGLRIGFVTYGCKGMTEGTARALEHKTAGTVRSTISNCCTHSQFLALKALENPKLAEDERRNFKIIEERYKKVKNILESGDYDDCFEALPFNSGYFMCVRPKNRSAEDVRKVLLEKYDTGVIALGGCLRIAFSSVGKGTLPKLFENIRKACD